eukprot:398666-Prymnesium_polylepis.4
MIADLVGPAIWTSAVPSPHAHSRRALQHPVLGGAGLFRSATDHLSFCPPVLNLLDASARCPTNTLSAQGIEHRSHRHSDAHTAVHPGAFVQRTTI